SAGARTSPISTRLVTLCDTRGGFASRLLAPASTGFTNGRAVSGAGMEVVATPILPLGTRAATTVFLLSFRVVFAPGRRRGVVSGIASTLGFSLSSPKGSQIGRAHV